MGSESESASKNSLFRKSSLERISSPDQLNEYIRVINPGIFLLMAGFFAIVVAVGIWALIGTIPDTTKVNGIAYSKGSELSVYTYMPMNESKRLSEGMSVQISPDYAPKEEYGYIYGEIKSIGVEPVSEEAMVKQYGNLKYLQGLLPQGNFVEVKIGLDQKNGKLKWSNQKGSGVALQKGAYCTGLVILKARKPYELVFSR